MEFNGKARRDDCFDCFFVFASGFDQFSSLRIRSVKQYCPISANYLCSLMKRYPPIFHVVILWGD